MHFDNYRTAGNFLTWEHTFNSYGFSFIEFLYFRFFSHNKMRQKNADYSSSARPFKTAFNSTPASYTSLREKNGTRKSRRFRKISSPFQCGRSFMRDFSTHSRSPSEHSVSFPVKESLQKMCMYSVKFPSHTKVTRPRYSMPVRESPVSSRTSRTMHSSGESV